MATSNPTSAPNGADKGRDTNQISSLKKKDNTEKIIHRTMNCIVVDGQNKRDDNENVSYQNAKAKRINRKCC